MSAPMVRAILEGRKTQTRRVVKPMWGAHHAQAWSHEGGRFEYANNDGWHACGATVCRYGTTGDQLWVRETWAVDAPLQQVRLENEDIMGPVGFGHGPYFRADPVHENAGLTWRPSIHMPRWASRITLEIVAVRVERLQEISQNDARAEGVTHYTCGHPDCFGPKGEPGMHYGPRRAYYELWNKLNAKRGYGWDMNPWVWVIEFKRL